MEWVRVAQNSVLRSLRSAVRHICRPVHRPAPEPVVEKLLSIPYISGNKRIQHFLTSLTMPEIGTRTCRKYFTPKITLGPLVNISRPQHRRLFVQPNVLPCRIYFQPSHSSHLLWPLFKIPTSKSHPPPRLPFRSWLVFPILDQHRTWRVANTWNGRSATNSCLRHHFTNRTQTSPPA